MVRARGSHFLPRIGSHRPPTGPVCIWSAVSRYSGNNGFIHSFTHSFTHAHRWIISYRPCNMLGVLFLENSEEMEITFLICCVKHYMRSENTRLWGQGVQGRLPVCSCCCCGPGCSTGARVSKDTPNPALPAFTEPTDSELWAFAYRQLLIVTVVLHPIKGNLRPTRPSPAKSIWSQSWPFPVVSCLRKPPHCSGLDSSTWNTFWTMSLLLPFQTPSSINGLLREVAKFGKLG